MTPDAGKALLAKTSEGRVFVVGMSHSPWNPELSLSVAKAGYKTFERRWCQVPLF